MSRSKFPWRVEAPAAAPQQGAVRDPAAPMDGGSFAGGAAPRRYTRTVMSTAQSARPRSPPKRMRNASHPPGKLEASRSGQCSARVSGVTGASHGALAIACSRCSIGSGESNVGEANRENTSGRHVDHTYEPVSCASVCCVDTIQQPTANQGREHWTCTGPDCPRQRGWQRRWYTTASTSYIGSNRAKQRTGDYA